MDGWMDGRTDAGRRGLLIRASSGKQQPLARGTEGGALIRASSPWPAVAWAGAGPGRACEGVTEPPERLWAAAPSPFCAARRASSTRCLSLSSSPTLSVPLFVYDLLLLLRVLLFIGLQRPSHGLCHKPA